MSPATSRKDTLLKKGDLCMKQFAGTVLVALFALSNLYTAELPQHLPKKCYVESQNICITDHGILIKTAQGVVKVQTLHSDCQGVYVKPDDMKPVEKGSFLGKLSKKTFHFWHHNTKP